MRLPLILFSAAALSACVEIQQATDRAGRDTAKTVLPEALAVYFPQVPKALFTPFTNCVVDNADAAEVQALAADAITGVDQSTADTIRTVLARPETQNCLRAAAPTALGSL
ncbi:hypothetical protein So717_05660 [Roseobacter cerasinus]|uniref:Succinate dehydrogenase n=1 Tax=Roseobacter cerasinus TaxID=2602289 RepID=A0A640VKH9_9RHOB|nr:hypothetical protein [Roseobacter cerasinus]GFE48813.1 hypothetical protein So717_05660 [Roseobacter cerasinus]